MAVASNVMAHLRVASDLKWSFRARAMGMRGLAEALAVLKADVTTTYDTLFDKWAGDDGHFRDVTFGDGTFSIVSREKGSESDVTGKRYGLSDEEGKINLNQAPASAIVFLLREAGMTLVRANELASYIVDWRDLNSTVDGSQTGAEACAGQSIPMECKNAPFEAMEELWWMPGMTSTVYNAIKGELTLYGSGQLNVNTASPLALRAYGLSTAGAERLFQWRSSEGHVFETPSSIMSHAAETGMSAEDRVKLGVAVASGYLGVHSDYFRGDVDATFGGKTRKAASFIVNRKGDVQWWRE